MELEFFKGDEVEVSKNEEGFEGAWFIATVVRQSKSKNRYLVEYQTLVDETESKPLREYADISHVRPLQPKEAAGLFKPNEEVEAFMNDGWWKGLIAKVLEDSKYSVYLITTNKEVKFKQSELRVHMEWIDGRWVFPCQTQETVALTQKEACFQSPDLWADVATPQTPSAVEENLWDDVLSISRSISGKVDDQSTPKKEDLPSYDVSLVQENMEQSNANSDVETIKPLNRVREEVTEGLICTEVCHSCPCNKMGKCNLKKNSLRRRNLIDSSSHLNLDVVEVEQSEVSGLAKPLLQCQEKQHALPVDKVKEPLLGKAILCYNRKRGRPKCSGVGVKHKRQSRRSPTLGMPVQSKGSEGEVANSNLTMVQMDSAESLNLDLEDNQTLSVFPEKFNPSVAGEGETTLTDSPLKSLEHLQSPNKLESSTRLDRSPISSSKNNCVLSSTCKEKEEDDRENNSLWRTLSLESSSYLKLDSVEAEQPELIGLAKPLLKCQRKQHDLPISYMKEPLFGKIKIQGVEGINDQTENAAEREKGRLKSSGVEHKNRIQGSPTLGMPVHSKGTENEFSSSEVTNVGSKRLLSCIEEDQSPSICVEHTDIPMVEDYGGVPVECTELPSCIVEEHLSPSVCLEKTDIPIAGDNGDNQVECTKLPSYIVEEHQAPSCLEETDTPMVEGNGGKLVECTHLISSIVEEYRGTEDEEFDLSINGGTEGGNANKNLAVVKMGSMQSLSSILEENQTLSVCFEKFNSSVFVGTENESSNSEVTNAESRRLPSCIEVYQSPSICVKHTDIPMVEDNGSVPVECTEFLSCIVEEHLSPSICLEETATPIANGDHQVKCTKLPSCIVEEHQAPSCLEETDTPMMEGNGGNQVECKHLMSKIVEEHRGTEDEEPDPSISGGTEKESSRSEVTNVKSKQLPSCIEEDQSPSICVEHTDFPMVEGNGGVPVECTHLMSGIVEEHRGTDTTMKASISSKPGDNERVQQNKGSLPIIKSSIESKEIFKLIPQTPHFRPLENENEELREGIALGYMFSFTSIWERTLKARLDDPKILFKNKLEALIHLEALGFIVYPIQSRLEELLEIKDSYTQLGGRSETINMDLDDKRRDFDEIEESITQLEMQIGSHLARKEMSKFRLAELKRVVDEIEESIQGNKVEFDSLVAVPL